MPTVDFARNLSVGSPAEEVWAVVTDVERVADWVSVLGEVEELKPLSAYRATLTDRLGPFRLSAALEVDVVEAVTNETIRFVADGEDRQVSSRIQIEARLSLSSEGDRTNLKVEGRYEVTGRVATLGASMIKAKGEKILDEFVRAATRELA